MLKGPQIWSGFVAPKNITRMNLYIYMLYIYIHILYMEVEDEGTATLAFLKLLDS